jgi:hypothetical protein
MLCCYRNNEKRDTETELLSQHRYRLREALLRQRFWFARVSPKKCSAVTGTMRSEIPTPNFFLSTDRFREESTRPVFGLECLLRICRLTFINNNYYNLQNTLEQYSPLPYKTFWTVVKNEIHQSVSEMWQGDTPR